LGAFAGAEWPRLANQGLSSFEQDDSSDQLDGGKKISSEFFIARGNGPVVLDFVEETLDEIVLAIEREEDSRYLEAGRKTGFVAGRSTIKLKPKACYARQKPRGRTPTNDCQVSASPQLKSQPQRHGRAIFRWDET